jgi:hypothetical protein
MTSPEEVLCSVGIRPERVSGNDHKIASRLCNAIPPGPRLETAIALFRRVCRPADFGDAFGATCSLEALMTGAQESN